MDKKMNEAREEYLSKLKAGEIEREYNLIKKSLAEPNSRSKAIHAKCFECYGGTKDEMPDTGWREFIRTCTAPDCSLYKFRPCKQSLDGE